MGRQRRLLIDSIPVKFSLIEDKSKNGKMIVGGEVGRAGVPTENGRIYPETLYEREIKKLQPRIKTRGLYGELDHPSDGKTKFQRVSHVFTDLHMKDSIVYAEMEILNTPNGKILQELYRSNCEVGASSRGLGSTSPGDGGDIVGEDFSLSTFDCVVDPAMKTAHPTVYAEDIEGDIQPIDMLRNEFPEVVKQLEEEAAEEASDKARKSAAELVEKVKDEVSEAYEKNLVSKMVELREEVEKEVRQELTEDPDVGGSKAVLAQIAEMVSDFKCTPEEGEVKDALKSKDLEIATVTEERDKALEVAKEAAFKLHLEKEIGDHPMRETIRTLMNNVEKVETLDEYKEKIETVMKDIGGLSVEEEKEEDGELKVQNKELLSRVGSLEKRLRRAVEIGEKLDSRAQEAMDEAQNLRDEIEGMKAEKASLKKYKAESVASLTNSSELKSLLEGVDSRKDVDDLVDKYGLKEVGDPELQRMRKSLRRGKKTSSRKLEEDIVGNEEIETIMGASTRLGLHLAGVEIDN